MLKLLQDYYTDRYYYMVLLMKKLLFFVALSFLNFNILFAEDGRINLLCKYENNYYRNWDQKEFGRTVISDEAQKSITFTIIKKIDKIYFNTTYRADWEWTTEADYTSNVSESEYNFKFLAGNKYKSIRLNRFDGNLYFLTGFTDDDNKYQWKVSYNCKKAEQKF